MITVGVKNYRNKPIKPHEDFLHFTNEKKPKFVSYFLPFVKT